MKSESTETTQTELPPVPKPASYIVAGASSKVDGFHSSTCLPALLSKLEVSTKHGADIVPVDTGLALLWLIRDGVIQSKAKSMKCKELSERQRMHNTVSMQLQRYNSENPLPTVAIVKNDHIAINIHVKQSLFEGRVLSGSFEGAFVQLMTPSDFRNFANECDHESTALIAEFISELNHEIHST